MSNDIGGVVAPSACGAEADNEGYDEFMTGQSESEVGQHVYHLPSQGDDAADA